MDLLNEAREIINEVDREMAKLFERRMRAAEMVAEYKKINGMPILDTIREEQVIQRNANMVEGLNISVSGGGYGIDVREDGLFKNSLGKIRCSVCPECGYVESYVENTERIKKLAEKA